MIKDIITRELDKIYPDPKTELKYNNTFELLVAVVLSAQSTDKAVNSITPILFAKYPTPDSLKQAEISDVEDIISRLGLYKVKAKNLINLSKIIVDDHNNIVPNTREDLEHLPGVGRKTANVVLSVAFDTPAFAVDTHVNRISKRLGLATETDSVLEVEKKLIALFDENQWTKLHHQFILFGRYQCKAQKPLCMNCPLYDICVYKDKEKYKY